MNGFSANAPVRLRLREPEEVVAIVPYLLGYRPEGELVCLALGDTGDGEQVRFVARTGAPGRRDRDRLAAGLGDLLAAEAATAAVVLVYSPPGQGWWSTLLAELGRRRIALRDAIEVVGGRWRSAICDNPDCCPPEGRPVIPPSQSGGPARIAAECVALGLSVADRPPAGGEP